MMTVVTTVTNLAAIVFLYRFFILCCLLLLDLSDDYSHRIRYVSSQAFLHRASIVSVDRNRNRDLMLRKIFHLRSVPWKPASVSVADTPVARPYLYRQPVLVPRAAASALLCVNTVQQLIEHLPPQHLAFVEQLRPSREIGRAHV